MEANMKTSELINKLVLIDAILSMLLGLGFNLTAPALLVGLAVPVIGALISVGLLATGLGPMFKGPDKVENNDPNLVEAEKADANGRFIYLGVTLAAIITLVLGLIFHKTEAALMAGGFVPIGGLVWVLVVGASSLASGKGSAAALKDFTSFSYEEEQTFVVYERVSLETEKRAANIAIVSVGSVGALFALVVLLFGGKGEHPNPVAPPPAAADQK